MGRFKEYLKKNTFKQTFGDVFKDYDLKQCVLLKDRIKKHADKVYTLGMGFCTLALGTLVIIDLIMKTINGPEGGLFIPGTPKAVVIVVVVLWVFMFTAGYVMATSTFTNLLNKRIKEIAGVTDNGEEEKGTD